MLCPVFLLGFVACISAMLPRTCFAQDYSTEPSEEIVANLCAGRVIVGVAKDGIVVSTLENPIEPQTRPPMIVALSGERIAVVLGAADWWLPDERREIARLDAELPSLPRPRVSANRPSLGMQAADSSKEATDIEDFAERVQTRLAWVANQIHGNLHIPDGQPILRVVLADYATGYGPEVWLVDYFFDQEPEQGYFWTTHALQPRYTQLWPPDKSQPHGLVEVAYPPEDESAKLSGTIRAGDPRLDGAIAASPDGRQVSQEILDGNITKLKAVDLAAFLRTSLGTIAAPKARMVEAEVNRERGIGWFIPPPQEPQQPGMEHPRPPGAPSLVRQPTKPSGSAQ